MADAETHYMQGVVADLVEGWVGEAEDYGEGGCCDVAEDGGPDDWDLPVFPPTYDLV